MRKQNEIAGDQQASELRLLRAYHNKGDRSARDRLIADQLPLVRKLARRYAGSGEPYEDLVQVGSLGLIKAVDRFDPGRGVEFTTYAIPTILGEIGHYLRDCRTTVRIPSRLRELRTQLLRLVEELTPRLGRSPRISELAAAAAIDEETTIEALECERVAVPLPAAETDEEQPQNSVDVFEREENWLALEPGMRVLGTRERWILYLRFFEDLTQAEIAHELGLSQMHVSRLLGRAIDRMRQEIASDA
jgi:RNA polymerase sigma-B factor